MAIGDPIQTTSKNLKSWFGRIGSVTIARGQALVLIKIYVHLRKHYEDGYGDPKELDKISHLIDDLFGLSLNTGKLSKSELDKRYDDCTKDIGEYTALHLWRPEALICEEFSSNAGLHNFASRMKKAKSEDQTREAVAQRIIGKLNRTISPPKKKEVDFVYRTFEIGGTLSAVAEPAEIYDTDTPEVLLYKFSRGKFKQKISPSQNPRFYVNLAPPYREPTREESYANQTPMKPVSDQSQRLGQGGYTHIHVFFDCQVYQVKFNYEPPLWLVGWDERRSVAILRDYKGILYSHTYAEATLLANNLSQVSWGQALVINSRVREVRLEHFREHDTSLTLVQLIEFLIANSQMLEELLFSATNPVARPPASGSNARQPERSASGSSSSTPVFPTFPPAMPSLSPPSPPPPMPSPSPAMPTMPTPSPSNHTPTETGRSVPSSLAPSTSAHPTALSEPQNNFGSIPGDFGDVPSQPPTTRPTSKWWIKRKIQSFFS